MFDTGWLRWTLPVVGAVLFFYILWLVKFKIWQTASLNNMILPLLYCGGAVTFLILIPSPVLAHGFSLVISIVFFLLVKNLGLRNSQERLVDGFRLNDSALLVCSFLIFCDLYALYLFLYLQSWFLMIVLAFMIMVIVYQYFWQERFLQPKTWLFIPVLGLTFAQLGWALTFWPVSFITRGIVMFTFFYCFLGLVKLYFNQRLAFTTAKKYLVISVVVMGLILGTSQWTY